MAEGQRASGTNFFNLIQRAKSFKQYRQFLREHRITEDDVDKAWSVLYPEGGVLTRGEALTRMRNFYPHMSADDVTKLIGPSGVSADKLKGILIKKADTSATPRWDREAQAWSILDPHGKGSVDLSTITGLINTMPGYDKLDERDMELIHTLLGLRKGHTTVTQEAFKDLGTFAPVMEELSPSQRRMLATRAEAVAARHAAAQAAKSVRRPVTAAQPKTGAT